MDKSQEDPALPVEEVSAEFARQWWKALMANVVELVQDAAALADRGSWGRAQALLVLAMEELAKARWIYEMAEWEWTAPLGVFGLKARPACDVPVPDGLRVVRGLHGDKLQAAERFASGLGGFWDSNRRAEYYELPDLESFRATARERNGAKQAGFYVDRRADVINSPLDIPAEGVLEQLRRTAAVIEMHLIEDHTRQQDASDPALIDSVQHLHWAILPYAAPEHFAPNAADPEGDEA